MTNFINRALFTIGGWKIGGLDMFSFNHKNKSKILMIAPEPFFENRGTPISVYQRVLALSTLGYQVDLLTYFSGKEIQIPGLRIYRTPKIPFIKDIPIGPSWKKVVLDVFLFFQAVLLLSKGDYRAIHSHEEASYFSSLLAAIFRLRHVYDMHSCLPTQILHSRFGRISPIVTLFRLLERIAIRSADAVITIGPDLDEYIHRMKADVNSIVIENLPIQSTSVIDQKVIRLLTEEFRLDGRVPIVYTGSFEVYQGLELLIASAKIIRSQFPHVVFILIGGKPNQIEKLRGAVRREQLDDYFIFTGPVSANESLLYMNLAEVLVSPRISGMSIPLKIYSYLNSGKAIVATNIEAHTRVLNNEISILTEPTAQGIAEGVMQVIRDPEHRIRLGKRAKLFAIEKLCFSNYLAKVKHVYETIYPIDLPAPYPERLVMKG